MSSKCPLRLNKANLQPSTRQDENRVTGEVWQFGDIAAVMLANGPEGRPDSSPWKQNTERARAARALRTFNLRPGPIQNNYSWAFPTLWGLDHAWHALVRGPRWVRLAGPKEPPLAPFVLAKQDLQQAMMRAAIDTNGKRFRNCRAIMAIFHRAPLLCVHPPPDTASRWTFALIAITFRRGLW